jgi:hypothetical protein
MYIFHLFKTTTGTPELTGTVPYLLTCGPPRAFTKANYHFDMRLAALSVVMLVTVANPSTGILITSGQADYAYENKTAKQVQPPPPPSPSVRTNAH